MSDPARALATLPDTTRGLVVAYSGGRDSTALLHALAEAGHDAALRAVHVCHHLQAESETWAAHCARWCAAADIEFVRVDVAVNARGDGVEAGARKRRYAALAEQLGRGDVLVCAHHALDQAETFLTQALRGAGVAGLAAMPKLTTLGAGRLWRPWLDIDRAAITAYAETRGLDWIEDPTNANPNLARGFLRTQVWPALAEQWPAAAITLSRSATRAAEAAAAVAALSGIDLDAARGPNDTLVLDDLAGLAGPRAGEVVRAWLAERDRDPPDHRHVHQILALIDAREHAGPRVQFAHTEVRRFDGRLFAMPRLGAPPVRPDPIAWPAPDPLGLPDGCGQLSVADLWPLRWPEGLYIRFRAGGESLPRDGGRRARLAERLRAARIPPWVRERLPLVYHGEILIAIPGYWQHPRLADWFGGVAPVLVWQHALVGGPASGSAYRPG